MTNSWNFYDNLAIIRGIRDTISMAQEYEVVRYPKIRHVHIILNELTYRSQHLHGDYEICFSLSGTALFLGLKENVLLEKGQGLFVDSNEVHSIAAQGEPLFGLFIQISNRFLRDYLPELHGKSYPTINLFEIFSEEEINAYREEACRVAIDFFAESPGYRIKTFQFVLQLLSDILARCPHRDLSQRESENRKKNAGRLKRIVSYIDVHHREKINLLEVAETEGITPTHLSHLFSEGLGISFQDYLNERRLEEAVRLLRNSKKSIIEISYEVGFSDPKYLNRLCRERFHCPPKEFRKSGTTAPQEVSMGNKENVLERILDDQEALQFLSGQSV